jgi:hypothetical protein
MEVMVTKAAKNPRMLQGVSLTETQTLARHVRHEPSPAREHQPIAAP